MRMIGENYCTTMITKPLDSQMNQNNLEFTKFNLLRKWCLDLGYTQNVSN